jgi:hypothetical protein
VIADWLWKAILVVAGLAGLVALRVLTNLATKEVEGRLNQLPFLILRIARWRLPVSLREEQHDEWWVPDLQKRLTLEGERPITRLVKGTRFAAGLAVGAGRTARAAGVPSSWQRAWNWLAPASNATAMARLSWAIDVSVITSGMASFAAVVSTVAYGTMPVVEAVSASVAVVAIGFDTALSIVRRRRIRQSILERGEGADRI